MTIMQLCIGMLDWSDFQIILAISRSGTLSDAARILKVSQSTISRALQRIETKTKQRIFFNLSGRYQITSEGSRFLKVAESFDEIVDEFSHGESQVAKVTGLVRITSIEAFISGYFVAALPEFKKKFPDISFELNGSNERMNLLKRGYDLSLRLDRERTSGSLIQKKITEIGVAIYTRKALPGSPGSQTNVSGAWLGYETALSEIPEEKWLRAKFKNHAPSLRVSSYVSMEKAIEEGLGVGLLPCFMGDRNPKIERANGSRAVLTRPIWLISHPEARRQPSVDCFVKWLTADLDSNKSALLGMP
jgi:DNA-binding transcriptional LysR family regulator